MSRAYAYDQQSGLLNVLYSPHWLFFIRLSATGGSLCFQMRATFRTDEKRKRTAKSLKSWLMPTHCIYWKCCCVLQKLYVVSMFLFIELAQSSFCVFPASFQSSMICQMHFLDWTHLQICPIPLMMYSRFVFVSRPCKLGKNLRAAESSSSSQYQAKFWNLRNFWPILVCQLLCVSA